MGFWSAETRRRETVHQSNCQPLCEYFLIRANAHPLELPFTQIPLLAFFSFFQILHERQLPGDSSTVQGVAEVLAASQKYMRDQSVGRKSKRFFLIFFSETLSFMYRIVGYISPELLYWLHSNIAGHWNVCQYFHSSYC